MDEIIMWVLVGFGAAFIPIILWMLIALYGMMFEDITETWDYWRRNR